MRAKDFIIEAVDVGFITNYIKKHHDENLHPDYLDNLNKFSKFILKNIPVNSLKLELSGLDRAKVEQYKKMNFDISCYCFNTHYFPWVYCCCFFRFPTQ